MKTLVLVPQGGLCNRLRAILSAVSLVAEGKVDADISVGWSVNRECAARYDQLFHPYDFERLTITPRRWYDRPITRCNLHWPALVRRCFYNAQYANVPPAASVLSNLAQRDGSRVYVSTGLSFAPYAPLYIRRLRPLPHLQTQIEALSAAFDSHTVGIHIRRTDHVTSIAESPDALFVEAMQHCIDTDPAAHFYLATDDAALKARLKSLFPGRVAVQQCVGTRSDLRGMEEAVVDLWTLARTSRLIGSYWSSFSDTAAEIGGISLNIIRK